MENVTLLVFGNRETNTDFVAFMKDRVVTFWSQEGKAPGDLGVLVLLDGHPQPFLLTNVSFNDFRESYECGNMR